MQEIIIGPDDAGKRVDKFLKEGIFFDAEISRGEIAERIKEGRITVNGKEMKPSRALKENDRIGIDFDFEASHEITPNAGLNIPILFEDDDILVINKPAGIRVHVDSQEKENTLVNFLVAKYPEISSVHDESKDAWMRPGIVHRLDKDTSGVMIVAKNKRALAELKRKFQDKEVEKKYQALAHGRFKEKKGVIEKPLARAVSYKKQVIANDKTKTKVREAVTHYEVLREFGEYALLEVSPKTGRMHQIRVHLASIGHPILGDDKYLPKNMKETAVGSASRHLLHAKSIRFELFGKDYFFETDLPDDFHPYLDERT